MSKLLKHSCTCYLTWNRAPLAQQWRTKTLILEAPTMATTSSSSFSTRSTSVLSSLPRNIALRIPNEIQLGRFEFHLTRFSFFVMLVCDCCSFSLQVDVSKKILLNIIQKRDGLSWNSRGGMVNKFFLRNLLCANEE